MEFQPIHGFSQEAISTLVSAIPFYKEIMAQDQWQYDLLMSHSRIIEYQPGEVVLKRGDKDKWLYFLLKGQLNVVVGDDPTGKIINQITPGEVFGDIALLFDQKRTATVVADPGARKIMVFGTDFQVFGSLDDFKLVSLKTKLIYFRNVVHSLRWKLELYRTKFPTSELASLHRKIKLFVGEKGSEQELYSLDEQARELAKLLILWNKEFGQSDVILSNPIDPSSLAAIQ